MSSPPFLEFTGCRLEANKIIVVVLPSDTLDKGRRRWESFVVVVVSWSWCCILRCRFRILTTELVEIHGDEEGITCRDMIMKCFRILYGICRYLSTGWGTKAMLHPIPNIVPVCMLLIYDKCWFEFNLYPIIIHVIITLTLCIYGQR